MIALAACLFELLPDLIYRQIARHNYFNLKQIIAQIFILIFTIVKFWYIIYQ